MIMIQLHNYLRKKYLKECTIVADGSNEKSGLVFLEERITIPSQPQREVFPDSSHYPQRLILPLRCIILVTVGNKTSSRTYHPFLRFQNILLKVLLSEAAFKYEKLYTALLLSNR